MARRVRSSSKPSLAKQIEKSAYEGSRKESSPRHKNEDLLPTGSTLLNLALSDNKSGGWLKGSMVNIIGDSSAGKSFVALTTLVEMSISKKFDKYSLIYDDVENANSFDMAHLFGNNFKNRIKAPEINDDGVGIPSDMIEDFQLNLINALQAGSCVYCLDSFDALNSEADEKKSMEMLKSRANGNLIKGSYGMAKAKKSSEVLRQIIGKLSSTKSFLSIISQTRDNVDPLSMQKKTRAGGKALKFYATHEIWLANGGAIKSKKRQIGIKCKIKITKNKLTGKIREIEFPIYYDYGIDNIGSCVDFLIKEDHWTGGGVKRITPHGLDLEPCTRSALILQIEQQDLEQKVSNIVGKVWHKIEDSLRLNRKPRYRETR